LEVRSIPGGIKNGNRKKGVKIRKEAVVIGFVLMLMLLTLWGWYLKTNHVEVFEAGGAREKQELRKDYAAAGSDNGLQGVLALLPANASSGQSKGGYETGSSAEATENSAEISEKININTAGVQELVTLDGIGEIKAREIVAYRDQNGAFERIEQILDVKGIGEATFAKIKDRITVGPE